MKDFVCNPDLNTVNLSSTGDGNIYKIGSINNSEIYLDPLAPLNDNTLYIIDKSNVNMKFIYDENNFIMFEVSPSVSGYNIDIHCKYHIEL